MMLLIMFSMIFFFLLFFGGQIFGGFCDSLLALSLMIQNNLLPFMFSISLFIIFFCICLYSFNYFAGGGDFLRFIFLLTFFYLSMLILIHHNSLLFMFIGWDGLGVTSYLLVCYYMNWKSINGAMTTLMTNRLGDICLFLFFFSHLTTSGFLSNNLFLSSCLIFFIIGCFTKSAQFPFSSWLPQAMSAPTPVSALVHSSTLVTAGIFLIMKYFFCLSLGPLLFFLIIIGLITTFIAGFSAVVEKDTKKIVALSTLSQLGFLMFSLGCASPFFCLLHLLTHAFFKSCMFIQVGLFISGSFNNQDSRGYSNNFFSSPISTTMFMVCAMSLCGMLFTSGFVSKDIILTTGLSGVNSIFFLSLFLGGIFFTFIYTLRMILFVFSSGATNLSPQMSNLSVYFSSVLLMMCGMSIGWFFFSSSMVLQLKEAFLEKSLMVFMYLLFFYFFISKKKMVGDKLIQRMGAQDLLLDMSLYSASYTPKNQDNLYNSAIFNMANKTFWVGMYLKSITNHWFIGGMFLLYFFVIYIF